MAGTLYVVGVPAGDLDDVTRRALRFLEEVSLVVADDTNHARRLLTQLGITTQLSTTGNTATALDALATSDVALLSPGWSPSPSESSCLLLRETLERGFSVLSVPGPSLLVTAIVLSGLPADSFVCLDDLPHDSPRRHALLASVAKEHRTLIIRGSSNRLSRILGDLRDILGDRPLTMVVTHDERTEEIWQGKIREALEYPLEQPSKGSYVLVIGGAREEVVRWDKDRLHVEVEAGLAQGLGAKEISQQLAIKSGWSRRKIYRLVVEIRKFPPEESL